MATRRVIQEPSVEKNKLGVGRSGPLLPLKPNARTAAHVNRRRYLGQIESRLQTRCVAVTGLDCKRPRNHKFTICMRMPSQKRRKCTLLMQRVNLHTDGSTPSPAPRLAQKVCNLNGELRALTLYMVKRSGRRCIRMAFTCQTVSTGTQDFGRNAFANHNRKPTPPRLQSRTNPETIRIAHGTLASPLAINNCKTSVHIEDDAVALPNAPNSPCCVVAKTA